MEYKVTMQYIGGILSDNAYKLRNRRTSPFVSRWMKELAGKVQELQVPMADWYEIGILGRFMDDRRPDLSNLHKVIGDSLKRSLPLDDKFYIWKDIGYETGKLEPEINIVITPINSGGG